MKYQRQDSHFSHVERHFPFLGFQFYRPFEDPPVSELLYCYSVYHRRRAVPGQLPEYELQSARYPPLFLSSSHRKDCVNLEGHTVPIIQSRRFTSSLSLPKSSLILKTSNFSRLLEPWSAEFPSTPTAQEISEHFFEDLSDKDQAILKERLAAEKSSVSPDSGCSRFLYDVRAEQEGSWSNPSTPPSSWSYSAASSFSSADGILPYDCSSSRSHDLSANSSVKNLGKQPVHRTVSASPSTPSVSPGKNSVKSVISLESAQAQKYLNILNREYSEQRVKSLSRLGSSKVNVFFSKIYFSFSQRLFTMNFLIKPL